MKKIKEWLNGSEREVKNMQAIVARINALEVVMEQLTDRELQEKTAEFKERHGKGETLEKLLPEAYAVVREASRRVLGMRHYDVQLLGGIALHRGRIAEMRTGEGKTLVSTLPVYLNALTGNGVHVVTVNEYLAMRDAEEMGQVHRFLGLSVALNLREMDGAAKKAAYQADIIYGTNSEFGFDYLRDNMVQDAAHKVQRGLHFCMIDEVDSILIDEARTPLIISGSAEKPVALYQQAAAFVAALQPAVHYTVDEKSRSAGLTEEGVSKVEAAFGIENLFDIEHMALNHHITAALKARAIMKRDIDYVVQNEEVIIIDSFTGRMMKGRRFSEGLHQAIEAKEGVTVQQESVTLATITFQNYFRMYQKLSGMTGTAKTEEEEFRDIYGARVLVIPTNKPVQRQDRADVVFQTAEAKYKAIVHEVNISHAAGQPVLVGTVSIETSELLSDRLRKAGVPHHVLNAKYHDQEADIIAKAGQKGAVTIATNMAGRGTDIKLGEGVQETGGLKVIGTERHESRRIDNQLRGRSGRQGDPGESIFFLSLEDELMRRFGGDNLKQLMARMGLEPDEAMESRMVTRAIESAQRRVEGNNFDARKWVLKYDDVLREQREVIYSQRDEVLVSPDLTPLAGHMIEAAIRKLVRLHVPEEAGTELWDAAAFAELAELRFLEKGSVVPAELAGKEREEIASLLAERAKEQYAQKSAALGTMKTDVERMLVLKAIDTHWMEHIDAMHQMRQGIHLRGYAQTDPLREYQMEGFLFFEAMMEAIEEEAAMLLLKMEIGPAETAPH